MPGYMREDEFPTFDDLDDAEMDVCEIDAMPIGEEDRDIEVLFGRIARLNAMLSDD